MARQFHPNPIRLLRKIRAHSGYSWLTTEIGRDSGPTQCPQFFFSISVLQSSWETRCGDYQVSSCNPDLESLGQLASEQPTGEFPPLRSSVPHC
jgi:hypothetical protein